jgi:drug/metabolite transporter (DMT)-like permease
MPGGARARNASPASHPSAHAHSHAHNSFHPINQATGSYKEYGAADQSKQKFSDSTAYWLVLYFIFNLGLTLFNKMVLVSFPFPYVSATTLLCEREH